MIADLKPYSIYINSGDPWIGQLPVGWSLQRAKNLFRLRTEKSGKLHGLELLSVYTHIGVRPRKELEERGNKATTTDDYWIVKRGDIIVNKLLAWMGAIGISHYDGVTSPAYDILRPTQELVPDYYHYLFRTNLYLQLFKLRSRGIMEMRLRLYFDQLGQIPIIVPPLDEQAAIVRFLDYANQRLDRAIRAKRKVIELLNEQKQAIIHRAITRGLDPNVPLKPSGIPWLGEIPAHWEVRRLRHLIIGRLTYGANAAAEYDNKDWPRYLRITDFRMDGTLRSDTFRSLPPSVAKDYLVQAGDILLARSGATVGKAFLVEPAAENACHAGYLIRARPNAQLVNPKFLFAFTQSAGFREWKDCTFNTATIQNIGADKYANLSVPLPPTSEQLEILKFIRIKTDPIYSAIARIEREIALLREYRTRLIADVVTGKLDVREAASHLPIEPEESDPSEPSDDLNDEAALENELPED
jgi:type I restriction enzyme S subunit